MDVRNAKYGRKEWHFTYIKYHYFDRKVALEALWQEHETKKEP